MSTTPHPAAVSAALAGRPQDRRHAIAAKGIWHAWRWTLARRTTQIGLLAVFMLGPWADMWWVRGNLASSNWFNGLLKLTDPYMLVQSLLAGHSLAWPAIIGAMLISAFFLLMGGRVYCGWICPLNLVTDAAHWLRQRLGLRRDRSIGRGTRLWLLGGTLLASASTGVLAWEIVNPVTVLQRGLLFGMGSGWALIAAIFLFDLLITRRGWCSHLCPVGAFYGLLGHLSPVRVHAANRQACRHCGACLRSCPEPHVIPPALKANGQAPGFIVSGDCMNCGACIDACPNDVFTFGWRPIAWRPRRRTAEDASC